tara:strand:- start:7479 stop:8270 length:792 start_codon:yes stop_codon:yes gene_type:complete
MFNMRNIINEQTRIGRQRDQRPHQQSNRNLHIRRRQFQFRNVYNSRRGLTSTNNNSNTVIDQPSTNNTNADESAPSSLQYNLFNALIDVSANNLTTNLYSNEVPEHSAQYNNNAYYSTFEYDSLNIRFFHNEQLNLENINDAIDNVIDNINNREIQNILNDFQNNDMSDTTNFINNTLHDDSAIVNSEEIIQKINKNITHGKYVDYGSVLKNHSCPILLSDFENKDTVSIFNLCNHAIHESSYEQFAKTFTKCPLCNNKLFKL